MVILARRSRRAHRERRSSKTHQPTPAQDRITAWRKGRCLLFVRSLAEVDVDLDVDLDVRNSLMPRRLNWIGLALAGGLIAACATGVRDPSVKYPPRRPGCSLMIFHTD